MFTGRGRDDVDAVVGIVIVQRGRFKHQLPFRQHRACRA